jgi:methyl-accepting chemotaxis protein
MKFLAVLGIFGVFTLGVALLTSSQMHEIDVRGEQINAGVVQARADLSTANRALEQNRAAIEWMLIASTPQDNQQADQEIADTQRIFDNKMSNAMTLVPANADEIAALKARADQVVNVSCTKAIQMGDVAKSEADNEVAQNEFNANCAPPFPELAKDMSAEHQRLSEGAQADLQALSDTTNGTILFTFVIVLVGFALVMAGAFFSVSAWVVKPLATLRNTMERLARGDLAANVMVDRKDEIGQMAKTVLVFKEAGLEKLRVEEAARQAAASAEAERERARAVQQEASAQQAVVVENLADGLERLSAGDLQFRLNNAFSPEYEKLRADFNNTVETLLKTMRAIATNTEGVRASASEITQSSDDLSRRTEQQAASLEETAAALDQITATVRKTSEGASEARNVVNTAKADAERSGTVVNETVTAMSGIESSSRQISNIIGVIDEIAFQTNLLALNAGVEAARAGDAGRGFAVVATEVRALAQRSADAAKEIKALISASGAQVETGVKLVGETGHALTRIVEQVSRLNTLITDIAGSAAEQAAGLAEVNTAVNQMDQVTQQNAAMVEEATAASHALASEAEALAQLVGQFRIGAVAGHARAAKPTRPVAVSKNAPVAPVGKFVAVSRQPAQAGADDWDEF